MFPFDLVVGWVLDRLTDAAKSALARKAERKAFNRALQRALYAFNARHPSWQAALLDRSFLQHGAAPVLADFVNRRGGLPSPYEVAAAWMDQFPGSFSAMTAGAAEEAVADLLEEFERQLAVEKELQQFLDRLSWDRTALNSERTAKELAALASGALQKRVSACLNGLSRAALIYQAAAEAHTDGRTDRHFDFRLQARNDYEDARRALILMRYPGVDFLIARFRELVLDPYGDVIDAVDTGSDAAAELTALDDSITAFQGVLDEEL